MHTAPGTGCWGNAHSDNNDTMSDAVTLPMAGSLSAPSKTVLLLSLLLAPAQVHVKCGVSLTHSSARRASFSSLRY